MRICFVSRRYFPAISGMSVYAINLLRQLASAGHDVTMVSQYRGDPERGSAREAVAPELAGKDDYHAPEPHERADNGPPADLLSEQEPGEEQSDQRSDEADCDRLGQRQQRQREEEQERHRGHHHAPDQMDLENGTRRPLATR